LETGPSLKVDSVKDLVAYAKQHAGTAFGTPGTGTSMPLAGVMFDQLPGAGMQHTPYTGRGLALNDLLGGQVSMSFTDILTALPYIKAGKLRAIGLASAQRSDALPDLPTLSEQGLSGYDVSVFFGIVAPKATPPETVAKLNQA
ncbi:tripartite tricarboxylate transporter substrate binding protein, partial [Campylobacter jejuni]